MEKDKIRHERLLDLYNITPTWDYQYDEMAIDVIVQLRINKKYEQEMQKLHGNKTTKWVWK